MATRTETANMKIPRAETTALRNAFQLNFQSAFLAVIGIVIFCFVIQKLLAAYTVSILPIGTAAFIASILFFYRAERRHSMIRILSGYHFAIALMTVAVAGLIAGTLILQNAQPSDYEQIYGLTGTKLVRAFALDNIFHSLWFSSLLALMAVSLSIVLIKRKPFRTTQLGFLFSHSGIILILTGALIGIFFRQEGFIDLNEGKTAGSMRLMKNGMITDQTKNLPFAIKLDDFQVDYYSAKYKLYAYRFDKKKQDYETAASFELKAGETQKLPGSKTTFKIKNITTTNSIEAGHGMPGRHLLELENGRQMTVEIGKSYDVNGWSIKLLEFYPYFNYSIEEKKIVNISEEPKNPAVEVKLTRGAEELTTYYFANMPDFHKMHETGNGLPPLIYKYELPACCRKEVPAAELQIHDSKGIQEVTLQENPAEPLMLDDGSIALVIEKRDGEVKEYRSIASVWKNNAPVAKGTIVVNSPLKVDGYAIYQSNYNPEDPTYSGFSVIKDPGLWLIYLGGSLLCLGVIWIIYITPKILARRNLIRQTAGGNNVLG